MASAKTGLATLAWSKKCRFINMAISARASALLERRKAFGAYELFGEKRRVLAPVNTSVSSIARRTLTAEIQSMTDRYNDGLVSNQEYFDFLTRQQNNPTLTPNEKVDIQDKIRDFQTLVRKDKLEAVYKAAPPNSLQQIQAAQALTRFYQDRAAGMMAGTPAQSQALENQAVWQQKSTDIQGNIDKQRRTMTRLQAEAQIAQLPHNSSQRAQEKAQRYADLYNTALAEGAETEAQRYLVQAQNAQTLTNELRQKETTTEQKQSIREYEAKEMARIAKLTDRSPSELEEKAQTFATLANMYAEMGDTAKSFQYQAKATEAEEARQKLVTGSYTKAIANDLRVLETNLKELERSYRYDLPYKNEKTGEEIDLTIKDYLTTKQILLNQGIIGSEDAIDNGFGNREIENKLQTFKDEQAKTEDTISQINSGTLAVVQGKGGKKEFVDISDPDIARKYAQGEKYAHLLEIPKSIEPGATTLTQKEKEKHLTEGRGYIRRNEAGYQVDAKGIPIEKDKEGIWRPAMMDTTTNEPITDPKTDKIQFNPSGKAVPDIIPEQYVDVRTEKGTERVWTAHNKEGNFMGWIPEGMSFEEADKLYKPGIRELPFLPQRPLTKPGYEKFVERRNIEAQIPAEQPVKQVRRTPEGELKYEPIPAEQLVPKERPISRTEPLPPTFTPPPEIPPIKVKKEPVLPTLATRITEPSGQLRQPMPLPKFEMPNLAQATQQFITPKIEAVKQFVAPKIEEVKKNIWGLATRLVPQLKGKGWFTK